MEDFIKVATLSEIGPGQRKSVWVEGQKVLLINVDGTIYAMDESCPHRQCSLEKAALEGKVITCPCHSARFNLETGAVVAQPTRYPPTPPLPIHSVKLERQDVLVSLGQKADYI